MKEHFKKMQWGKRKIHFLFRTNSQREVGSCR